MNSDPYDSAAWRTFGMLDADESAIFDEAMRHDPLLRSAYLEMDRISAGIAAATTAPIEPRSGQLERLLIRLHLNPSIRRYLWLGISGWAAAAVLAVLLVLNQNRQTADQPLVASPPSNSGAISPPDSREVAAPTAAPDTTKPRETSADSKVASHTETAKEQDGKAVRVETKRLVQEIEVLRENLEKFQHRDRVLFEAVPGMALPIVMRMNPPGLVSDESPALAKNEEHAPITAMLGDALRAMTATSSGAEDGIEDPNAEPDVIPEAANAGAANADLPEHPTAIPIYDAARDSGTLVVNNLPPAELGKVYNLWVTTTTGGKPIYVGSLPESSASGADSFDFSLGSNMVLPSGFVLTKDPQNAPATPTATNTILQGPPTPGR